MALINKEENSVLQKFFFQNSDPKYTHRKKYLTGQYPKKNQYKTLEKNIAQDEPPKYLLEFR